MTSFTVTSCAVTSFAVRALVLLMAAGSALSQGAEYPVRPVRMVVVYGAGGGLDIVTRIVAEPLTQALGRQVVVENRPGAGGNIGTEYVSRATPDGYTLMVTTNSHQLNSFIYKNPGYDPRRDFVPVIQMTGAPSVIIVNARSPMKSLKDLVSAARAKPRTITFGSAGNGSPTHIAMEMFKSAAGIDLVHLPYKTAAQANGDVVAGQTPLAMAALPSAIGHIQGGSLRPLGVTTEKRSPALPDVPAIAEAGYPGFSHVTWIGVLAPAATPRAIVERVNREIATILANEATRARLAATGVDPVGGSVAELDAMLKAEYDLLGKLIARIGLKID